MAAIKSAKLKQALTEKATENASVTKGTRKSSTTLKQGVPNDHSRKHFSDAPTVGVSVGVTKNMDNYESLRVDVWLNDAVREGETFEEAYSRVSQVTSSVLQEIVSEYC